MNIAYRHDRKSLLSFICEELGFCIFNDDDY